MVGGILADATLDGRHFRLIAAPLIAQFEEDAVLGALTYPTQGRPWAYGNLRAATACAGLSQSHVFKPSTTCPLRSDSSGGDLLPEPPQLATNLQRCVCGDRGLLYR